ncbi:Urea ABC transporter, permease protein UrtB [hydrothermal vent metagenome]|uniref:Urea ABC transporter, permease protein UrtB n=1 Tax=hydrothermal vent metagenome TaxID=652676 RepID=A0A3B1AJP8_9ZZZZ
MQRLLSIQNLVFITLMLISGVMHTSVSANTTAGEVEIAAQHEIEFVDTFEQSIPLFTEKGFKKKTIAVDSLAKIEDTRVLTVFQAMLTNKLYYVKSDQQVVFLEKIDDKIKVTDVISNEILGISEKSKLKKISVNNKLRKLLRGYIAALSVKSQDDEIRAAAVNQLIKNMSESSYALLISLVETEENKSILTDAQVGIALWDLGSNEKQKRLAAITTLHGNLLPEVKTKLESLALPDADGNYLEADELVRVSAKSALVKINDQIAYYGVLENIVFGLSLGSVLLLIAIGLAITFGVMGVINMAHGELMMIGAYTAYVVQQIMPGYIGASIFVAMPLAFVVAGAFGIAIERLVIRFMYGRPLETLLATFGISLILQQMVRVIFGPTNQAVVTPQFMSGSLEFNPIFAITYNRLYIFAFSIMVLVALVLILKKTSLGLQVRAVSQNRSIAKAMGVRSEWIDALTFGLGAGIAGLAGVALSQLTNVGPNLGQAYIIDSFMVVVFGGVGNLWGTLVAAMSLGVINKFLEPWAGAVMAKILVLVFIILFIQKRPRGLFPQKGRAAES